MEGSKMLCIELLMMSPKRGKLILPRDDFLKTMSSVFKISRIFGVAGSSSPSWKTWGVFVLAALMIIVIWAIWKVIKALSGIAIDIVGHRSVTARLAGTMFYSISTLSLILCWRLSCLWTNLSHCWVTVERSATIDLPPDGSLKKRMRTVIGIAILCSVFEHLMSVMTTIGFDCEPSLILKRYILLSHGFLFLRTEYDPWLAVPVLVLSIIATVLWNLQDLLIVLISMGLSSRYNRLNLYLARVFRREQENIGKCDVNTNISKWRRIREAYVQQALLVRRVDAVLGFMILLSCYGNFYFICLQLFLGITQAVTNSLPKRLYYIVSLSWLLTRTVSAVLAAAEVNVHSRNAVQYLRASDTGWFNVEMERLLVQLTKDNVALSGMGFFYLNRNLLLKMAGAVVTYELMLIQFDNKGYIDA